MIELAGDRLVFSTPEVHPEARLSVSLQRTLRIPDDGRDYPLPPGLGKFPLRRVDDLGSRIPERWLEEGGVVLPMYQSEALWLRFNAGYPFAVQVAAGRINAVSGKGWGERLVAEPQDYLVVPEQPWLDGFCVEKGRIRQFVAMPLGAGYTAEEQLTGEAAFGGIQIAAFPMRAEEYERWRAAKASAEDSAVYACQAPAGMGLAAGGRMRQEIYEDPYGLEVWDQDHGIRCHVHLANSLTWRAITGGLPPTLPRTAAEYTRAGLPWFEYYAEDLGAVEGGAPLRGLKSVADLDREGKGVALPENETVVPDWVIHLRKGLAPGQVRGPA